MTVLDADPDRAAVTATETACAHCGLPVPRGLLDPDADQQFCCAGCRAVFAAIHSCGLEQYYALRDAVDADGQPARTSTRRFEEFDDEAFRERYCRGAEHGLQSVELALEGVHCAACLWLIERLPHLVAGVAETRLNLRRRIVHILWNDDEIPLSRIARQLASLGYVPHAATAQVTSEIRRAEDRRFLIRIAVAGALGGNVMLIAFALYGGMFHGIEPQFVRLFQWTSLGLTGVSLLWPGRVFFRGALAALRARTMNMDVPIAVGLSAGTAWSVVATVRGIGEVYFDSVTLLVFLLLVGRWIQLRQQRQSSDAVELLFSMTPRHARLIVDDAVREIPVDSLQPGMIIEVRPGDVVPADGVVTDGASTLDEGWLTGESRPVPVDTAGPVHAGSTNLSATLRVRVDAIGASTRAGRLMQLVEDSAHRRAPIVRLADRIAGWFVAAVLLMAVATAAVWWRIDPTRAVENAIALLIITCPCALGLATPLALVAALGGAARRGILIKGGDVVEALTGGGGRVFLDKTGTITEGRVTVREWHGPQTIQPLVAALEASSTHPVGRALAEAYGDQDTDTLRAEAMLTTARGVGGRVDGRALLVGTAACLAERGVVRPDWAVTLESEIIGRASSPVFIAVDGVVEAVVAVGDAVREEAAEAVRALRQLGWDVAILSGDHPDVVDVVGAEIGIDAAHCHGGVAPEEKLRVIEHAVEGGRVIMVGDGVNDAAALAAATVGIAVHGGAEASLASADVYLQRDGLAALPEVITGSSRTLGAIRRGLAVSLVYNLAGSALAIAGLINPLVAAILMPISSLTVITLAFRAKTFGGPPCP